MAKSQIIKDLANGTVDTQTALKRTKVLLQELDDEKLIEWINYEIEGYPSTDNLPEYRKIGGQLYGTYFKGSMANHMTYNHVPLPLGDMPSDDVNMMLTTNITQGIEALKSMIAESEKGDGRGLSKIVPADYYPMIATYNKDPYMIIVTASVELNMPQIRNIFPKVENKLLDILRYLEKQFGNLDDLDIDVNSKSGKELKEIAKQIFLIIYNDQSISVGNNNKIEDSTIASKISDELKKKKRV